MSCLSDGVPLVCAGVSPEVSAWPWTHAEVVTDPLEEETDPSVDGEASWTSCVSCVDSDVSSVEVCCG